MFLKVAAFVIPLGFDTFAVAVLLGLGRMRPLRPAATFTFFEAVMPLVGLLIGRLVGARFETPAVVVGGIVLLGVAIYMFSAWRSTCSRKRLNRRKSPRAARAGVVPTPSMTWVGR
jgi:putative Mn2+ efflux pump MntP